MAQLQSWIVTCALLSFVFSAETQLLIAVSALWTSGLMKKGGNQPFAAVYFNESIAGKHAVHDI